MATCLVHMRVREGQAAAFEAIARSLHDASVGQEKGLLRYEYWRGQSPNSYYCFESFDDYAGFLAHEIAPYHEAAAEPVMALIEDFKLEWIDPVPGTAPFGATREQALAADAGERTRFYAEMFPLSLAMWWAQSTAQPAIAVGGDQ